MRYHPSLHAALFLAATTVLIACPGGKRRPADATVDDGGMDSGSGCSGVDCPWPPCNEAGCFAHQRCVASPNGPVCVPGACEPGFVFAAGSSTCERDVLAACGAGSGSIVAACGTLHRTCTTVGGASLCGACESGYDPTASACSQSTDCVALGCGGQNRACPGTDQSDCGECSSGYLEDAGGDCIAADCSTCDAAHRLCSTAGSVVQCGVCASGYVQNADSECETLVTCASLACGTEHRTCGMSPNGHCEDACEDGWVWDTSISACRAPTTCGQLNCSSVGQICIPESGSSDARCDSSCPGGSGWDYQANGGVGGCVSCGSGPSVGSTCTMFAGATGRVIAEGSTNGTACFCETFTGYFPNVAGTPERCDVDDDGWLREGAADPLSRPAAQANRKLNARCTLRTVSSIRVRNEDGQERIAESFALPLPLYEATENDEDPVNPADSDFEFYGTFTTSTGVLRPVPAPARNSLTKACVHQMGDYNRNGLRDVEESQLETPAPGNIGLLQTFSAYTRSAYFLELHDGWFVPNAGDPSMPGTYLIVERSRTMGFAERRVPVVATPADDDYWQVCDRHVDVLYQGGSVTTRSGGDFTETCNGASCAVEMTHHSAFKCMVISASGPAYVATGASAQAHPWRGYWYSGTDRVEWDEDSTVGMTLVSVGSANVCLLDATAPIAEPSADPVNPRFLDFSCATTDLDAVPPPTGLGDSPAHWVLVDYTNAGHSSGSSYRRGCINECAERTALACPGYAVSVSAGFDCYEGEADQFGELECGCRSNYIGTNCEMACAASTTELLTTGAVADGSRHVGPWLCMRPVASDGTSLSAGGYSIRGAVQSIATDGALLSGSQYSIRAVTDGTRGGP